MNILLWGIHIYIYLIYDDIWWYIYILGGTGGTYTYHLVVVLIHFVDASHLRMPICHLCSRRAPRKVGIVHEGQTSGPRPWSSNMSKSSWWVEGGITPHMGGPPKIGGFYPPKWMVYFMENPMNKWMIWGVFPLFLETPIFRTFIFEITGNPRQPWSNKRPAWAKRRLGKHHFWFQTMLGNTRETSEKARNQWYISWCPHFS